MPEDHPAAFLDDADLVGVIDVGSNSIRLVVFEDNARSPDYVFNEKTICRLGEGLAATGRLSVEGRERAMAALHRFKALAEAMGVTTLLGVGTAALRDAEDGPEFCDRIAQEVGVDVRVATGGEEAKLAAEGVLMGWPQVDGIVADMGGSSLEMAEVANGEVGWAVSTGAGHLRLSEASEGERRSALLSLAAAARRFGEGVRDLILVGGAWRALAKAHMSRINYPLNVLMGFEIDPADALALCDWIKTADNAELKKASGASTSRVTSLHAAADALSTLINIMRPQNLVISAFGLREGMIFERMPPELRRREPLIAAAERMEARSARSPGFGLELYDWLSPVFPDFSDDWLRLAKAACLLHDVNWRAHPDFRAVSCFATVTRSNLSGVGHKSRVFIGAALIHRYKSPDDAAEIKRALELISAEERRAAEAVGRGLRLGAMLAGSVKGMLTHMRLAIVGEELVLTLEPSVALLAGERVERRLAALANAMGLRPRLVA